MLVGRVDRLPVPLSRMHCVICRIIYECGEWSGTQLRLDGQCFFPMS
ncbi:hypothetical protein GBAR_LOCUS29776, partial [Geodia barretti]